MDQQRRDFMKLLSLFSLAGSLPLIQACEQVQKMPKIDRLLSATCRLPTPHRC